MTNAAIFRPTCIIQRTSPRRQTVDNRVSWFMRTSRIGAYIPHVTINRVTINNLGAELRIYIYTIVQLSRLNLARHRVPIIYKRQWRRFPYINWRAAPDGGGRGGRVRLNRGSHAAAYKSFCTLFGCLTWGRDDIRASSKYSKRHVASLSTRFPFFAHYRREGD